MRGGRICPTVALCAGSERHGHSDGALDDRLAQRHARQAGGGQVVGGDEACGGAVWRVTACAVCVCVDEETSSVKKHSTICHG